MPLARVPCGALRRSSRGIHRPPLKSGQRWAYALTQMPSPFAGLKVPQGNDRRELYKSQYRAIYTCTCSLAPGCQRPPTLPPRIEQS